MPTSAEKELFDKGIRELYPYLPFNYGRAVVDKYPSMTLARVQAVVRGRGTEPDWEVYRALKEVQRPEPVGRQPRKKHKPRTARLQAA